MSYGLEITRANGRTMLAPASRGGVFVGLYTAAYGATGSWTFPNIPAGGLTPYMIGFGGHQVVVGSSGGVATLTLNPVLSGTAPPLSMRIASTIAVFARLTNEGNYGVLMTSEDGERSISSLYPVPVFLGKLTFSATPTSSFATGVNGFTRYTHTVSTSLGAGRTRMILWTIPSSSLDVWYTGTSYLSNAAGAANVDLKILRAPATTPVLPQGFVFALDGLAASGSAYGLQCFNASGQLTYDSNLAHWRSIGLSTYGYPATSAGQSAINTYTMADYAAATTPLLLIQPYHFEAWTSGAVSTAILYDGFVKRSGTTLSTRTAQTGTDSEDAPRGGSYASALSSGISHLILDGADY